MGPQVRLRDPRREPGFERFVADFSTWLLRTAYLLSGERGAAEDLLQLTLLRTARRWHAAQRAPEAYARRVLVNLVRDRHRHAARRVPEQSFEETVNDALRVSDHHTEAVAARDEVMQALARLPIEQREVLVLRFYADLSVAESAAAIGTSEGTVKSRTSRALARMRELLLNPVTASTRPTSDEVADDH